MGRRKDALPTTPKACLRCRGTFESEGPGNRLCQMCRRMSQEVSPFEPHGGGLPDYMLAGA